MNRADQVDFSIGILFGIREMSHRRFQCNRQLAVVFPDPDVLRLSLCRGGGVGRLSRYGQWQQAGQQAHQSTDAQTQTRDSQADDCRSKR